jgi:hypothetical protein
VAGIADNVIVGYPAALWITLDVFTLPDAPCSYDLTAGGILGEGDLEVTLEVKAAGIF